jgi:dTDP-4-dehydrorhamnose 3,5-epimerase
MLYLHTAGYDADSESALNALDPRLGINWPTAITERSLRDEQHAWLEPDFQGIDLP